MADSPQPLPRNRSISAGASELPQHEHKRPRLDTETHEFQDMNDSVGSRPQASQSVTQRLSQRAQTPLCSQNSESTSSIMSPTSRVTINTRPISAQSLETGVLAQPELEDSNPPSASPSPEIKQTTDISQVTLSMPNSVSSEGIQGDADEPISIASSPSEAVVELEPPEDVDTPSEIIGWSSLGPTDPIQSLTLWESFPYSETGIQVDVPRLVHMVADVFEKDESEQFTEVLHKVTHWMNEVPQILVRTGLRSMNEDAEIIQQLPGLANSLLRRKFPLPTMANERDILGFIKGFAAVAMQVVTLDTKWTEIRSGTDTRPWFQSNEYITAVHLMLQPNSDCALFKVLRMTRHVATPDLCAHVARILFEESPQKPFQAITMLFCALVSAVPITHQARLFIPRMVLQYRVFLSAIHQYKIELDDEQKKALNTTTTLFLGKAEEALQQAIVKQHQWLNIDTSGYCLDYFTRLINTAVTIFPEFAESAFRSACLKPEEFDETQICELAADAHRLSLLRRFIQQGRMELRVSGIEIMATTLVEYWTRISTLQSSRASPLLGLVVGFLRNTELIEYLLGVDCHPQIVTRSANVIGFLCVSDNWTSSDSDMAWEAILGSQDHRSVAAVTENLRCNLQHLHLDSLMYMHQKVAEIPFERFDARMLLFVVELLKFTITKAEQLSGSTSLVNNSILKLCLHLLQQSNVPSRCDSEVAQQIREHIFNNILMPEARGMGSYKVMELAELERDELVTVIMRDVRSHTDHATGSILVMTALLNFLNEATSANVVMSSGFAKLLMEDMIFLAKHHQLDESRSPRSLEIEYSARLSSLRYLILQVASVFDTEMCESLWGNVLTSELPAIRSNTWAALAEVYRGLDTANPLLEYVAQQFTQSLNPLLFDQSVLEFCQASVEFEILHEMVDLMPTNDSLQIPSMERMWKILLETPHNEVQAEASKYMIRTYISNKVVTSRSIKCIQNTHTTLINRCIQIVIDSALLLKNAENIKCDGGTTVQPANQQQSQIHRSLGLLRTLLTELKTKDYFKPTSVEAFGPVLKTFEVRGEPVEYQLRINNCPELRIESLTWKVGQENTGHELWKFLIDMVGWSQILIIKAGARLQLENNLVAVKDLRLGVGPFHISRPLTASDTGPGKSLRPTSPVDTTIMRHFGSLYDLLELTQVVAKPIYDFLTTFSSQENVLTDIKSMAMPAEILLPVRKPFKLLYYANALRGCIEEESFSSSPDTSFLQYAVQTVVATLKHLKDVQDDETMCLTILTGLIETLQLALRAKVSEETSASYFAEPESFMTDLLGSWKLVQNTGKLCLDSEPLAMDRNFLDVLIEATLHDESLWQYVDDEEFAHLLGYAILEDSNLQSRVAVHQTICKLAGVAPGKFSSKIPDPRSPRGRFSPEKIDACLESFWKYLRPLIAQACLQQSNCQQVMESSVAVFDTVCKRLDGDGLMEFWHTTASVLLTQHDPSNKVYCSNEKLPLGLSRLLAQTAKALNVAGNVVPNAEILVRTIYQQFLFPPLSDADSASTEAQSIPVLEIDTRGSLYDLLMLLCQSPEVVYALAGELAETMIDKDAFSATQGNERKALKSEQGYAGLKNLSNTCYLNSLFSQLFMNVKFRQLIIGINITDEEKQKLVKELGNVFANMQSSYEKCVDPEDAIEAITQYSGEQIDVTVQMDVDEFFNLLFDRLESQILDASTRDAFKGMYGGQLVQQIKSKECEHISERLEPFSAVQVEIKGKSRLEESLSAYVEGEVLQGENKYSCTGCGRHVDAIKRACLKEIPDNLIFNLKRFDYDIMTGVRRKVNDEFQFPETIDMMPYTVDALSQPNRHHPSDMFELVGVIIHSGTAETGHYYSFVRQRPCQLEKKDAWIQFNDQDVTKFDPSYMKEQAFGGSDGGFTSYTRFYSGYMLFYQRSSSTTASAESLSRAEHSTTVKLPRVLDNSIALHNEISLRRYVAQDPSHAKFVRQVTERMRIPNEPCSPDHQLEDQLIGITLEYIQLVSSRWKEAPEFEETIKLLCEYAKSCAGCALTILEWYNTDNNLMELILKGWYPLARKQFATLLFTCWSILSPLRHTDRQLDVHTISRQRLVDGFTGCLSQVDAKWEQLQKFNRGWEQLFTLFTSIARLGKSEAHALIESNLLADVLEIVWVHNSYSQKSTPSHLRNSYKNYFALREKNRLFSHAVAMEFLAELLPHVSLERSDNQTAMTLSDNEKILLSLTGEHTFEWLRRLIAGGSNPAAASRIIQQLCEYPTLAEKTATTLIDGLVQTRQYTIASRFLLPCFTFIQYSTVRKAAVNVLKKSLQAIAETDCYCSSDYQEFVSALIKLELARSLPSDSVPKFVLAEIGNWAPMLLIAPDDIHHDVRGNTLETLRVLMFNQIEGLKVEDVRTDNKFMEPLQKLAEGCIAFVAKYLSVRNQEQRLELSSSQTRPMVRVLEASVKYFDAIDNAQEEALQSEILATIQYLNELEHIVDSQEIEWEQEPSSEPMSDSEVLEHSP